MERGDFAEFFLASAGAGGAFVGLLFVAISIGPQRTFGRSAVTGALRQHLAEAVFLALVNAFVVSSVALVPGSAVGWIALVLGTFGVVTAVHLSWAFARFHRHPSTARRTSVDVFRSVSLSIIAIIIFAIEAVFGLLFIRDPTNIDLLRGLAFVIVALYTLGIFRAWMLLGDPQYGWSGWLNPLQDLPETDAIVEQPASSSKDTDSLSS